MPPYKAWVVTIALAYTLLGEGTTPLRGGLLRSESEISIMTGYIMRALIEVRALLYNGVCQIRPLVLLVTGCMPGTWQHVLRSDNVGPRLHDARVLQPF